LAPDISKFNFEDMTGITSTVPDNIKLAGLNKPQTNYLDKVGKKIPSALGTTDLFTYDSPADIKKEIESLNTESDSGFFSKEFDPDKITYGDKNTYATDQDVENYMKEKFGLETMGKKIGLADGGRIGFAGGGDPRRRLFLKMIAGAGAGIAGLKSGLIGMGGKEATKKAVTETVKSAGSGTPPPYFFRLVEKIKFMGDDTLATTDKAIAKKYKDYTMEEDFAGNIEIIKKGDNVAEDVYISYKVDDVPLRGKKGSKRIEEYEEYTARPDAEGKMKDIEQGVPDEVIDEAGDTTAMTLKKASGGIARMLGE